MDLGRESLNPSIEIIEEKIKNVERMVFGKLWSNDGDH